MENERNCWHASTLVRLIGSPLTEIIERMRSGKFYPITDKIEEGEIIIGQLSIFEKALFTVRMEFIRELEIIAATSNKMLAEAIMAGVEVDIVQIKKNKAVFKEKHQLLEIVNLIFWMRLKKRLNTSDLIGVRGEYQVVKTQPEEINFFVDFSSTKIQ
jgi:hypothetical protein